MKITIRCTDLNVTPSDASGFILTCEVADAAELANHFDDEIDKARRLGRAFRESILDATEEELREAMGDEEFEKQAAAGHAVVQRALASVAAPQEEQGGAPPYLDESADITQEQWDANKERALAKVGGAPDPEKAILNTHKAIRESMKPSGPDWEGFGRQILETYFEYECCDIDGADIFEWAKGEGVILETKYNPKVHGEGADANPGDEWFVVAPRAEAPSAPVGLTEEELSEIMCAAVLLEDSVQGEEGCSEMVTSERLVEIVSRHRSAPESGGGEG